MRLYTSSIWWDISHWRIHLYHNLGKGHPNFPAINADWTTQISAELLCIVHSKAIYRLQTANNITLIPCQEMIYENGSRARPGWTHSVDTKPKKALTEWSSTTSQRTFAPEPLMRRFDIEDCRRFCRAAKCVEWRKVTLYDNASQVLNEHTWAVAALLGVYFRTNTQTPFPSCYYLPPLIHLLLPTPSDQSSPAAGGYQSPSCVGPVKWKMAATERAHFREPSSFEGAWWPLTATVLTWSPHQHSTAIMVFTKARGAKRIKGRPCWSVSESGAVGSSGCAAPRRHCGETWHGITHSQVEIVFQHVSCVFLFGSFFEWNNDTFSTTRDVWCKKMCSVFYFDELLWTDIGQTQSVEVFQNIFLICVES